jgi:hypothetical protein
MNRYQITIGGIHCHSCVTLLNMYFEEAGLQHVRVDAPHQLIDFETDRAHVEVNRLLEELFSQDLSNYQFSDLILKP